MKKLPLLFLFVVAEILGFSQTHQSIFLKDISWTTARSYLTPDAVVVIPLGAQAKEHGPHLPLSTDYIQAEGVANLVAQQRKLIIAPIINYGFYPNFLSYPGSTSIDFSTASDMILNIVRSIAGYGPKRFYVINIGISTTPTLAAAAKVLAEEGILLYYSDYNRSNFIKSEMPIKQQAFGGHAAELETSNIIYLRPDLVDMNKAVNDTLSQGKKGILSPTKTENTAYSPSGIEGYATLATKEKGKLYMHAFTLEVIKEIDSVATCKLYTKKDRTKEYKAYEGEYISPNKKSIIIQLQNNQLRFKTGESDFLMPFTLYQNGEDFFSSQQLTVLFERNQGGRVVKGWFRFRDENMWMIKTK
jgi:creatinine amidohydrolase